MFSEKTLKLCERIKAEGMKKVEERKMYVLFNFGSYVYLSVNIYDGLTLDECVYLRSEDIDMYLNEETKEWKSLSI